MYISLPLIIFNFTGVENLGGNAIFYFAFADDHSRICLKAENSHDNSDYVNASPIVSTVSNVK